MSQLLLDLFKLHLEEVDQLLAFKVVRTLGQRGFRSFLSWTARLLYNGILLPLKQLNLALEPGYHFLRLVRPLRQLLLNLLVQ